MTSSTVQLERTERLSAAGLPFVIESDDPQVLAAIESYLVDLRDTSDAETEPTVFTVRRAGPPWLSHPWGVWRDDTPCELTLADSYVVPYVLWEITRLVIENSGSLTSVHAGAVEQGGRGLILTGPSRSGKSTLTGWLVSKGWGYLTDEVALLDDDSDAGSSLVQPFWRPIGVRHNGPLAELVGADLDDHESLVPASRLGRLAEPTLVSAIVLPEYRPGTSALPRRLSPAAALEAMVSELPGLGSASASRVFARAAQLVESVPAFSMDVDDLDEATDRLAALLLEVSDD